jgi:steroid delta-isomerase-like uncharacterized protein
MSAEENKALAKRFFDDVCNARKLHVADELFSAGHTYTDPAIPGIPPGPEGQKVLIGTYQTAFPDAHWEVEEMLAAGDKVVTRWIGSGTHKAVLQGNPPIPPTGKKVRVTGVWIHRISGGKIVETWNHWDMLGMLQQLGVIPSPK